MTEETPAAILRRWSKENQGADRGWLVVCERMASSPDMEAAWPSLLAAGAKPLQVFNMVTTSITESNRDIRRLAGKEELKSIEEVKKATSALLIALQGAQLLNESAPFIDINNDIGLIAWTDYRAKILTENEYFDAYIKLSLPDLLRMLKERCEELSDAPPPNAIQRQTKGKEWSFVRAFVRRMGAHFQRRFGDSMPENLARITCAVLQPDDPLTDREVGKILGDSPFWN